MATKKIDWGYAIRTGFCVLAFLASAAYFAQTCSVAANNYLMLANPAAAETTSWFISFVISTVLFLMMLGVTVALVRPTWISIIAYAIGSVLFVVFIGSNMATWITAAVSIVVLVLYLLTQVHLFENQIKASTHPLGEKKILICSLLAALLSVAVGVGYAKDAAQRNYIIPPEAKTAISQYLIDTAKTQLETQGQTQTEEQKQAALTKAEGDVKTMMDEQEQNLKASATYIPILLGVFVFCIFQIILIFVSLISVLLTPLLFWILGITHFTHTVTEKCEVSHLTLKSTN